MVQIFKRILAAVVLAAIVLCGISRVESVLNEPEVARVRIAHSLIPPKSADVVFVGSSKVFTGVVPQLLMDEYGIASINANSPSELFSNSLLQIKSILRTQKPKVIVCELMGAATVILNSEAMAYGTNYYVDGPGAGTF